MLLEGQVGELWETSSKLMHFHVYMSESTGQNGNATLVSAFRGSWHFWGKWWLVFLVWETGNNRKLSQIAQFGSFYEKSFLRWCDNTYTWSDTQVPKLRGEFLLMAYLMHLFMCLFIYFISLHVSSIKGSSYQMMY